MCSLNYGKWLLQRHGVQVVINKFFKNHQLSVPTFDPTRDRKGNPVTSYRTTTGFSATTTSLNNFTVKLKVHGDIQLVLVRYPRKILHIPPRPLNNYTSTRYQVLPTRSTWYQYQYHINVRRCARRCNWQYHTITFTFISLLIMALRRQMAWLMRRSNRRAIDFILSGAD